MKYRENANCKQRRWRQNGLSVLELLIVLSCVVIVVLITIPGSNMLLQKYRLKTASSELLSGLELARTEAHMRSSTALMCPSSNGHSCRNDGNWNHGWLVFSDGNGNGTVQDIELIRSFGAPNQAIRIVAEGAVQKVASFTMTGLVEENGAQTGQFTICLDGSESLPRVVSVNAEGWINLVPPGDEICETS